LLARRADLCKAVISRDRRLPFFAPMRGSLHAASGIPNFPQGLAAAAGGCMTHRLHETLSDEDFCNLARRMYAGALGARGGLADWDLFVFVISDSSAGLKVRALFAH
jgi:hypothetical protein